MKSAGSSIGELESAIESYLSYLGPQIRAMSSVMDPIIVPLALVGLVYLWRSKNLPIIILTAISSIYILIPLFNFPRAIYYMMVPISLLAGMGLWRILQMSKNFRITGSRLSARVTSIIPILLIIMVFSPTMVIQFNSVSDPGQFRDYSELDEDLFHPLGVSHWALENISPDRTIAFPNAGAVGRVFSTMIENKVYFAERRYSDLPQYRDIAAIYAGYPTYDTNLKYTFEERLQIIEDYNISVIIEGYSFTLRNVTLWRAAFPNMQSYVLYDWTYVIRILY